MEGVQDDASAFIKKLKKLFMAKVKFLNQREWLVRKINSQLHGNTHKKNRMWIYFFREKWNKKREVEYDSLKKKLQKC